MRVHTVLDVN